MATIRNHLAQGTARLNNEQARLESEILLAAALGVSRTHLYAHPDEPVGTDAAGRFEASLTSRGIGYPVAYLTGVREFWSRPFTVDRNTLIPRPETELLVEHALARIAPGSRAQVLDLGTGSGVVAITLALECPHAAVIASDSSHMALKVARTNVETHRARVGLVQSDWLAAFNRQSAFDLIVSNPPYIADADPHLDRGDIAFEPQSALLGGLDGLVAIRTIAGEAIAHLASGGHLLLEHGFDQGADVRRLLSAQGFKSIETMRDLAGKERVTTGTLG